MSFGHPKLFTALFLISLGSCLSTVKQTCSRLTHLHSSESVSSDSPKVEQNAAPPTSAATVSSGSAVLQAFRGHPSFVFNHRTNQESCASGVDEKIILFDANTAVQIFAGCRDIEPDTVKQHLFRLADDEETLLIFNHKLLDRDDQKNEATSLWCEGGIDSAGRKVTMSIKRNLASGEMMAHLTLKGQGAAEKSSYKVKPVTEKGLTIYVTGEPAHVPYFALSLANLSGLTGFLTYDFTGTGSGTIGRSRKENKIILSECLTP
jgi:hypothetical protein